MSIKGKLCNRRLLLEPLQYFMLSCVNCLTGLNRLTNQSMCMGHVTNEFVRARIFYVFVCQLLHGTESLNKPEHVHEPRDE